MTIETWLEVLPEKRREEARRLVEEIQSHLSGFTPRIEGKSLGWRRYRYACKSGRTGERDQITLSARKDGCSLHVIGMDAGGRMIERRAAEFPAADAGRSCLCLRRAEALLTKALRRLRADALAQTPPEAVETLD